jgi:hypothetical protein
MLEAWSQERRIGEFNLKLFFGESENLVQIEVSSVGIKNKSFICAWRGFLLAGTGEKTIGTAEEAVTDFGGKVRRNFGVGFDGQVAYTFSGVKETSGPQGARRTGRDALIAA